MQKIIGSRQFAQTLGISLRTLDALDNAGDLPKSFRVGHMRRWREEDIDQWIMSKLANTTDQVKQTPAEV